MFDHACAQGTSQFKSPFDGAFDLVDRTCPWSMPNWACCCPDQFTFLKNLHVSGTMVEAIVEEKIGKSPKVPVDVSGLSKSLQYLRILCSQAGPSGNVTSIPVRGTTDKPRRLYESTLVDAANDETFGKFAARFQLSSDNSRLYWTLTLDARVDGTLFDISMACSYARSPSAHACTSSASALFNPPTMATLPAAFALAYLFQAGMALAC